jgi:hypothetical protein
VLGAVVIVLGGLFVFIGANALVGPAERGGEGETRRRPVAGVGSSGAPPSRRARTVVAAMWVVLGALFLVAAFTHQVP